MRILSFDIGAHSIKAVELEVTFGRVELADYVVEKVTESEAAPAEQAPSRQVITEGQLGALRRILSSHPFRYDRLVMNMPRGWVTTRVFHFPTKDRKALQSSLGFELDDDIPFAIGDVVHDFTILSNDGTTSTVFTAVALKPDLAALLGEIHAMGLDPDMVTIEAWSMSYLIKRGMPKEYEGRPVCVVNLGARQTQVHMLVGDGPVLTHTCAAGGDDVTRAIAKGYDLSFDKAEQAKIDGSFLLTQTHLLGDEPLTEEQKKFSGIVAEALAPVAREIKQTLMSYKSGFKLVPKAIFLTGGTSLIPNLPLFLEEQLRIPVFPLSYMSQTVGPTLRIAEAAEARISAATGLALSMVKIDRARMINFRRDAFAKRGGLGDLDLAVIRRPLKYLAASLAFVYLNLIVQGVILSTRHGSQEAQLEHSIKAVVGAVSPSVMSTYRNSPSALKSAVNKEIAKYKPAQAPPSKAHLSPLDLLNKVSAGMPKDFALDMSVFQIKDGKLRLAGLVGSAADADRVAKALEETKTVTGVTKDKSEEDAKAKRTKFEISAKLPEAPVAKAR